MTGAKRQIWDIAVLGAGPAGACSALAALAAAPGATVLLLDRARFPRDKACGDGVAPHVLDVLDQLGAADVVDGWTPLRQLDLSRADRAVDGRMERPVWVIPRTIFDARLVAHAVTNGATLTRHHVRQLRRQDGVVLVDGTVAARVVVGADGAYSVARAALPRRVPRPRAIVIRGYAPTIAERRGRQIIRYGERPQPAYAWSFDRGDGLSNVGYGELASRVGPRPRTLLLDQLDHLLPGTVRDGTSWRAHHLPLSGWGWGGEQPDGPVLLAGDAAGLINPMTGEGIFYAVATGALAGRSAAEALLAGRPDDAGRRYRVAVRRLLGTHFRHTWLTSRLARHSRVVDAGIAAAVADRGVFADLVELGLGDGRITTRLLRGLGRHMMLPAPS